MGHGPNLAKAIRNNNAAQVAVNEAVKTAIANLKNTEEKARLYINSHTKGIVEIEEINSNTFTKYSDENSLKTLDVIVDSITKQTQNNFNLTVKAVKIVGDTGAKVKSTLGLYSTKANQNLQVVFKDFISGDYNYAIYYATNSMIIDANNAWGNKELTVVSNMFLLAQVKSN